MFSAIPPVTARPVQTRQPVAAPKTHPTESHKPVFGLTTISLPQPTFKAGGPVTPKPSVAQSVGTRLDYYA